MDLIADCCSRLISGFCGFQMVSVFCWFLGVFGFAYLWFGVFVSFGTFVLVFFCLCVSAGYFICCSIACGLSFVD